MVGKIRTYLHLSLKVSLSENDPHTTWGKKLQVILNDVARVVVKKRTHHHHQSITLQIKTSFFSLRLQVIV